MSLIPSSRREHILTRFQTLYTISQNGCWQWIGYISKEGYARIKISHTQVYGAHRIAYDLFVGPVPTGLEIDHLCRNRACVNPAHLEAVSHRTNMLRGEGVGAENARKTHCIHGHEFTVENTYFRPDGKRDCRACIRARVGSYQRRKVISSGAAR